MSPTVAISGGTSFTALWIAQAFHAAGWKVHALCSRPQNQYEGLKKKRLALLQCWSQVQYQVDAINNSMMEWISQSNFDVWIHHHHFMEDFRSQNYNIQKSQEVAIKPLAGILDALKSTCCNKVIFSGSYFENSQATPYAKSKAATWNRLQELSGKDFILSKVLIPDPIGPLENEDRLIPTLLDYKDKSFLVRSPDAINDHLPVRVLAKCYVDLAAKLLKGESKIVRPSGLQVSNKEWVHIIAQQLLQKRFNHPPISFKFGSTPSPSYVNPAEEHKSIDWDSEWDHYATIYKENRDR